MSPAAGCNLSGVSEPRLYSPPLQYGPSRCRSYVHDDSTPSMNGPIAFNSAHDNDSLTIAMYMSSIFPSSSTTAQFF